MNKTKFSRKELYDLVWSKSLTHLAKEFAISDNGLRKICKKHNIPLPKMGHWQKVTYGKKLQIIPLPKIENETDTTITLDVREVNEKGEHILSKLARITKEIESEFPKYCKVQEQLIKPDILVKEARTDLKTKKPNNWRGHKECISTSSGVLSISVAKENVGRALRFMDTLIKLLRKRGHDVSVEGYKTRIIIDGEKYKIRFREKHTRTYFQDGTWDYSELIPNGKLSLKFDNIYDKEWCDGKVLIEKQLVKIVAAFEIRAENDKIQRAEWEIRRIEQERLRAIREKEEARLVWEQKKVDILMKHSSQWNQSEKLKQFIEEIEKLNIDSEASAKTEDWIRWAKSQHEKIDPLAKGVDMLFSEYEFNEG